MKQSAMKHCCLCTINHSGFLYRDKHLTVSITNEFVHEGAIFMLLYFDSTWSHSITREQRVAGWGAIHDIACILCERGVFFVQKYMVKTL